MKPYQFYEIVALQWAIFMWLTPGWVSIACGIMSFINILIALAKYEKEK